MTKASGNIILEELARNITCLRRGLMQEELTTVLGALKFEHQSLMQALKQSAADRNKMIIHQITEVQSQIHLVIAEVQERIEEISDHLMTLENKKKIFRSYGMVIRAWRPCNRQR